MNQLALREPKHFEMHGIPLVDILRNESFAEGFIEVVKAQPFNASFKGSDDDRWHYERGRLVANEALSTFHRVPRLWCETETGRIINPLIISLAGAMFFTGAFA